MPVRDYINSDVHVLGTAKLTVNTTTAANFDFGTPNDVNLATATTSAPGYTYKPGDRVLAIFRATSTGTSSTVSFSVQDADDNAGNIGTPATALTSGTLTGGTGDEYAIVSVRPQSGRPWLRFRSISSSTVDDFIVSCVVLGIPEV